jgi:tetratricopeptide (TPR) repeat protein
LGTFLARQNDLNAAIAEFKNAIHCEPGNAAAHANLGQALAVTGDFTGAESEYLAALQARPFDVGAHRKLADLLRHEGRNREAIFHYQVALTFGPDAETRLALGGLCYQTGDAAQAVAQFQRVLKQQPENLDALNNLAWLLATWDDTKVRNGMEAVRLAEKACQLTGYKQPRMTGTLAAAYAEAGRYDDAVATGNLTVKLANDAGDQSLTYVGNFIQSHATNHPPPIQCRRHRLRRPRQRAHSHRD